jgi:hypothetical protein
VEKLGEQVRQTLVQLKADVALAAAALFDDDRARLEGSSEGTADAFWDVFRDLPCLEVDWGAWYQALRLESSRLVSCTCGEHALRAQLVGERFVLVTVSSGPISSSGPWAVAAAVRHLASLLPPPVRRRRSPGGGGEPEAARLGIPLWWVRRSGT